MIFTPTDRRPGERLTVDLLMQLADDVRQLTEPWSRTVWKERVYWTASRNKRRHRWMVTLWYPPLLMQLAAAVHPGGRPMRPGPVPPRVLASRVPISVDACDRLVAIERGIADWMIELEMPYVGGRAAGLRALVGAAAAIDPERGKKLAADVRQWFIWAAKQAGHNPLELIDERSGS
jgi:hypothetical protein